MGATINAAWGNPGKLGASSRLAQAGIKGTGVGCEASLMGWRAQAACQLQDALQFELQSLAVRPSTALSS